MGETITTIKLQKETKERLDKLKEHNRESYDETLRKMLGILNLTRQEPEKARSILGKIDETRERIFAKEKKEGEKRRVRLIDKTLKIRNT
jgi:hypothetical protein